MMKLATVKDDLKKETGNHSTKRMFVMTKAVSCRKTLMITLC